MQALLNASLDHFRKRNLKLAQTTAQIAVDFAKQSGDLEEIFKANLLLAKIYTTNARYTRDRSFFDKANSFLAEAEQLPYSKSVDEQISFFKTKGNSLQQGGNLEEAIKYFDQCLQLSKEVSTNDRRIDILVEKGHCLRLMSRYDEASEISNEIEKSEVFLSDNNNELKARIHHLSALIWVQKHDYSRALGNGQALLALSRDSGNLEQELIALNVMAIVSGVKANFKIAAQYFQDALAKSEGIGYRYYIAQCLINIATIYAHLYNYEDAIDRYNEVLENYKNTLDDHTKVAIFNNVGNIHYKIEQFDKAKDFFLKALTLANEKSFKTEAALAMAQLSRACTALGDTNLAQQLASDAQKELDTLGNVNGTQINLINSADIYFHKNEFEKATELVEKGIQSAVLLQDDVSQITGFRLLSKIYNAQGDFEKAFEKLSIYTKMKEDFDKQQRNRQFLDLEIRNAIKRKQTEIEQLTKENELQSLLLEKGDQIERQNRELLSMNEDLRQFAYIASHDLKEPLRMISSYAQILLRLYGNEFDDNAKTYFGYMTEGVTRMNQLLEDLLKYATVGRNEEELEELELDYIVEISRVNLKVLMQETEASIDYEELPIVNARRSMLIQLMQNLISNAIKFRKPDIAPKVVIKATETEDEFTISISDNCIGIDKDNIERIFVIFQRLHARSTYEGTGIGLAICQKIAQRLGGRIWAESEVGIGSTFFFTIPK